MNLIKNGIYKKDNILIDYNDKKWWIPKSMFDIINSKKKIK